MPRPPARSSSGRSKKAPTSGDRPACGPSPCHGHSSGPGPSPARTQAHRPTSLGATRAASGGRKHSQVRMESCLRLCPSASGPDAVAALTGSEYPGEATGTERICAGRAGGPAQASGVGAGRVPLASDAQVDLSTRSPLGISAPLHARTPARGTAVALSNRRARESPVCHDPRPGPCLGASL